MRQRQLFSFLFAVIACGPVAANDDVADLASRIDDKVDRRLADVRPANLIDESGFIRRVTLDLAGRIPTTKELDEFRQSESLDKRVELVRRLIDSPDFAFHQRNELDTWMLRRLEHNDQWREYLLEATQENRSWDKIFREVMLPEDECPDDVRPVTFLQRRMQNLDTTVNDSSIIWFGVNVACAKCHDHPLVDDWKQAHYYGMASFFKRTFRTKKGMLAERLDGRVKYTTTDGDEFEADFMFLTGTKVSEPKSELDEAKLKELQEAIKKAEKDDQADAPRPEFRPRMKLVDLVFSDTEHQFFAKNIANRIWARMFGRGLVHPLDQMHSENPPSHPELLDLLSNDLRIHGYDLKRLIHAIALTDTYARRMHDSGTDKAPPESFASAMPRPLSPHQLSLSLKVATTSPEDLTKWVSGTEWTKKREELERNSDGLARKLDIPDAGFQVSVSEALWFSNNPQVQNDLLNASGSRLVGYLTAIQSNDELVGAAVKSVLSRDANTEELRALTQYLDARPERREDAIGHIVWALLGSPEFRFNH